MESLEITIEGIHFGNPIVVASGPAGFGPEFFKCVEAKDLGAFTTKTVTPFPKNGNPPPRLVYVKEGLLNSIGLQNPGVDEFVSRIAPTLPQETVRIISIGGENAEDFVKVAKKVEKFADMIEVNLSCPNVRNGGVISSDAVLSSEILTACKEVVSNPLIAKISPDLDVVAQSENALKSGVKFVNVGNSLQGAKFDVERGLPFLKRVVGGLSGPAFMPILLWKVYQVKSAIPDLHVIGLGGVSRPTDVIEYAIAGASLVSVGSYAMNDPKKIHDLVTGVKNFLNERGLTFSEIVAASQKGGYR